MLLFYYFWYYILFVSIKKFASIAISFCFLLWAILFIGCPAESEDLIGDYHHNEVAQFDLSVDARGAEDQYIYLEERSSRQIAGRTFNLTLTMSQREISRAYFIFTNASNSFTDIPKVTALNSATKSAANSIEASSNVDYTIASLQEHGDHTMHTNHSSDVLAYNNHAVSRFLLSPAYDNGECPAYEAVEDTMEGDRDTFVADLDGTSLSATARYVVSDGADQSTQLAIWVDDREWCSDSLNQCSRDNKISYEMIRKMAEGFLTAENNIYHRMVDVFGEPWGDRPENNCSLISPEHSGHIHILLTDIGNDNSDSGGILGQYISKDNYLKTSEGRSNERIMFYIDSVLFASAYPSQAWTITNPWPEKIISTLTHEFQHLINFYQRRVLRGIIDEVWFNEMLSLAAEDLLANATEVSGPRGIMFDQPSAKPVLPTSSRMNLYICHSDDSLIQWTNSPIDYSTSYSLAAYLLRNYGADNILRNIYRESAAQNSSLNNLLLSIDALRISDTQPRISADRLLRQWSVAGALSDSGTPYVEAPHRYNVSPWIESGSDTYRYRVGAIDLYSYRPICGDSRIGLYPNIISGVATKGFYIWPTTRALHENSVRNNPDNVPALFPVSNTVIMAGGNTSGILEYKVTVPPGAYMTIVVNASCCE